MDSPDTGRQVDLLREGQLRDEVDSPAVGLRPLSVSVHPRRRVERRRVGQVILEELSSEMPSLLLHTGAASVRAAAADVAAGAPLLKKHLQGRSGGGSDAPWRWRRSRPPRRPAPATQASWLLRYGVKQLMKQRTS